MRYTVVCIESNYITMDNSTIKDIAKKLVEFPKGILAADESVNSATKRLDSVGVGSTEETRMQYRDLFFGLEGLGNYLSGVILHEETLYQKNRDGVPFVEVLQQKNVVPGIKVDMGLMPFPGFDNEVVTAGLDGLGERLVAYREHGALFTKWRAAIRIGDNTPTDECIHTNAVILARYARIVQDVGMVPMVEPEVLLEGVHGLDRAEEVIKHVLEHVMYQCERYRVDMEALILKTSMVVPGRDSGQSLSSQEVADATVRTLKATLPDSVAGVVFLSGGQSADEATSNLNMISQIGDMPWPVTFSYARALQGEALKVWSGKGEAVDEARTVFANRLRKVQAAVKGEL